MQRFTISLDDALAQEFDRLIAARGCGNIDVVIACSGPDHQLQTLNTQHRFGHLRHIPACLQGFGKAGGVAHSHSHHPDQ